MSITKPKLLTALLVCAVLGISWAGKTLYQSDLFSNNPFLKKLAAQLSIFQETTAEERVYLHFDKHLYEPGEDIWFSAYVRDAHSFEASKKSEVVYVEFLSPKGSIEQSLTLLAQTGQAKGTFALPESIKGGLYTVKAYTNWQKNSAAFFEREITIQKPVLPNLNMRLNFNKKAYGAGETVEATLDLNSLTKEPLAQHAFNYVIALEGNEIAKKSGQTDALGRALVSFKLPKKLATNDGLLNVLLQYKGQTESISRSIPIVLGNIDVAFYPEGGQLLEGIRCGVGFKALNEFGKPADISGNILNQKGDIVASFESYHQGMGKVDFIPKEGEQYHAQLTQPSNISTTYPLPVARNQGLTMRVNNRSRQKISLDVLAATEGTAYVVAQSRNEVQFTRELSVQKGLNNLSIPTSSFPIGITQLTLFNDNQVAVAERLVFVNPNKHLQISIKTDKEKYLPREKVSLTLEVKDEDGRPVSGDFSLAVVDDKLLNFADDKQGHLLAALLLEQELTGTVVEPNFYFDKEDDPTRLKPEINRQEALDHLLLTQGWRKFAWKEVVTNTYKRPTFKGEMADIAGTIVDIKGQPVAGITVALSDQNKTVITDAQGQFIINDWNLYESVNLQVSSKGFYPIVKLLNDYQDQLNFTVYRARTITGVVKDPNNKILKGATIWANNNSTATTDAKGKFSITVPENIQQLRVYSSGYGNVYVPLKESNQLDVTLSDDVVLTEDFARSVPSRSINRAVATIAGVGAPDRKNLERARKRKDNQAIPPPPAPVMVEEVEEIEEAMLDDAPQEEFLELVEEPVAKEDQKLLGKIEAEKIELLEDEEADEIEADIAFVLDRKELEVAKKREAAPRIAVGSATRYHRVREFPTVSYANQAAGAARTDFRSTVYWNPSVRVEKGRAQLEFYNNDAITQFRVTVEGFGTQGQLGRLEYKYFTQLPFEMLSKVPSEVLTGDELTIPLTITNNSSSTLKGQLTVAVPTHLRLLKEAPKTIQLDAGASKTIYLQCVVLNQPAEGDLVITLAADGLQDQFSTTINARPRGFPVQGVFAGNQMNQSFTVTIQEVLEGSLVAKLQAYPSTLDEVMKGMESLLRMPSGCFEQTSSSNYPNLLVLDYLRETNTVNPELEAQVKGYLKTGYARLTGYESPSGGFDWWGRDPGHEALSAYGLMEFVDMKRVFSVKQALIDRTAKWLLSRRDGNGGWTKNPHALHSWAAAEVTDAYIVWAMTEAGYGDQIKPELDKSYQEAIKSEDPYRMALLANALFKANDTRAPNLVKELANLQQEDGSFVGLSSSVTNSTGQSLMVETSSLAVLAMLQSTGYNKAIQRALKAIQGGKNHYGYGSTQGTVLALKALLEHAKSSKKTGEAGTLLVAVDGKQVATVAYVANQKEISLPNLGQFIKEGKHKITVQYADTKTAMPWDLELSYTTTLPQNSSKCPFSLQTTLPKKLVNMGENIRLTTTLTNTTPKGQPMTMVMIGIPAGLSVQAWQLKELQEQKAFDYYELFDGFVVLHYEQLTPSENKTVHLDLKADVPGNYEAPASSAFLYYTNEHRVWAAPERLAIR